MLAELSAGQLGAERQFRTLNRLSFIATTASTPAVAPMLCANPRRVRLAAINVLRHIGGKREAELIASALGSEDPETVCWAARALSKVSAQDLLPEMVNCLDGNAGPLKPGDRWELVKAISSTGRPDAVEVLARCAVEPSGLVRKVAAEGLRRIGTPASRAALEVAANELSVWRGRYAREALKSHDS